MKRAWYVRNMELPVCEPGFPLGRLEVTKAENGDKYELVSVSGKRTALHVMAKDAFKESVLVDGQELPVSKCLYQRPMPRAPGKRKVLPHDEGVFKQGPIVSCQRHFVQQEKVNLEVCDFQEACRILYNYLKQAPMSSKEALFNHFCCSPKRMGDILNMKDLIGQQKMGAMRVYSAL